MSDVSFIRAAPAPSPLARRRAVEAPEGPADKPAEKPAQTLAPAPDLSSKTKVKAELRSPFAFAYTFIDAETDQVVGRWPIAPPLQDQPAPGQALKRTL